MDIDVPLEGDDEATARVILPPREEWPPAVNPLIKGVPKIIEDRTLED